MLCEKFTADFFRKNLSDLTQWTPFPPISDRESWDKLNQCELNRIRKTEIIEGANALINQPWPELTATLYAEFIKNGNRTKYEGPYFQRRNNLGLLVLAECFENRGRYIDEIINGIWSILSEPCWTAPAHARYIDGDILPDPNQIFVDLFAGTTAMTLAQTYSLLKNKLETASPGLCETLKLYLDQRIFTPLETLNIPHWWLDGRNNWTPWCIANVLGTALIMLADDRKRLISLIMQLQKALDLFIEKYDDDGGCDEGPMYWNASPGHLLLALELLNSATNNAMVKIYENPKIKNMGEYIYKVHMGGKWCFSPADAGAILRIRSGIVYRYGEKIDSENMRQLAINTYYDNGSNDSVLYKFRNFNGDLLPLTLRDIFWMPKNPVSTPIKHSQVNIFPDLQVMIARENTETETGFTIGCKAGSNNENHNHNDIGQFEIFYEGTPVIIDLGAGQYTRKTFSDQRYDIWYIGAQGHNVPQINGILQSDGSEFHATDVSYENTDNIVAMSQDITQAYAPESQLKKLTRQVTLDRSAHQVKISDCMLFQNEGNSTTLPLLFQSEPHLTSSGAIEISVGDKVVSMNIESEEKLKTELQKIELDDVKQQAIWGNHIYKLQLTFETDSTEIDYALNFLAINNN